VPVRSSKRALSLLLLSVVLWGITVAAKDGKANVVDPALLPHQGVALGVVAGKTGSQGL
jgi:hypothetical protein